MDKTLENIFNCFDKDFYNVMKNIKTDINEVRIRSDKPVVLYIKNKPYLTTKNSDIIPLEKLGKVNDYVIVSFGALKNAFSGLCEYSI